MASTHFILTALCAAALALPTSFACAADASAQPRRGKTEIVAHRGSSFEAPENTMAAFNLGWKDGSDAVELDLHLTSDGKLISIHDKDTLRVTGGENGGGTKLIVVNNTAETLRKLDVGKWKDPQFAGEKMPMFEEVLASVPKDKSKRLFIEVKVGAEAAAPLVAALKKANLPAEQTAVISFKYDLCKAVKELAPQYKVFYLSDFKVDKKTNKQPPTIDELIQMAKDAKLDGLDLSQKAPLDPAAVKRIRDAKLELYMWTIDDPAVAQHFIDLGADGITTNRPKFLREQLEKGVAPVAPSAAK